MKRWSALILALVLLAALTGCGTESTGNTKIGLSYPIAVSGTYNEDGSAFLPDMNGGIVALSGDISSAAISPDRKTVVFLDGGTLYMRPASGEEKTEIMTGVKSISVVRNKGVLFTDKDGNLYRRLFTEPDNTRIGEFDSARVAPQNLNVAYGNDQSVYFLGEDTVDRNKIGTYDKDIEILRVSNGGSVAWSDQDSSSESIMLYENGEMICIATYDLAGGTYYRYSATAVEFDASEQYITVMNYNSDTMYLKKVGEEAIQIKLGDEAYRYYAYTENGYFDMFAFDPAKGLYVLVGTDKAKLYWISEAGEREKVVSDVSDFCFSNGYITYRDNENNLMSGKLDKDALEPARVTTDVTQFWGPINSEGLAYYMRDVDSNGFGSLYAYKAGESDPVKIKADVLKESVSFSPDGRTIFFYTDAESLSDEGSNKSATLYFFTYGDQAPTRVSSEVIVGSLTSGLYPNWVQKNGFMFKKYSFKKDGKAYFSWEYYDGTASAALVRDVTS